MDTEASLEGAKNLHHLDPFVVVTSGSRAMSVSQETWQVDAAGNSDQRRIEASR